MVSEWYSSGHDSFRYNSMLTNRGRPGSLDGTPMSVEGKERIETEVALWLPLTFSRDGRQRVCVVQ